MPKISGHLRMGNVKLICVEYGVNEKYDYDSKKNIPIQLTASPKVKKRKNDNYAIVSLELRLFQKNSTDFPIWFKVKNQAVFEWDEYNDKIGEMLHTVAPAHLLSYIRPLVTQLTTMSDFPPLTLPLFDFSEDA